MQDDIVIVGGGQAALSCAVRLRDTKYQGGIAIIAEEDWSPYQRPPLSKAYLLGRMTADRLELRSKEFFKCARITVLTGKRAIKIDRARRRIEISDGSFCSYGKLVIATGSRARTLPEQITRGLKNILTLRTINDADILRHALHCAKNVAIIGGGYIGLEVASICAAMGHRATIIEAADRLLKRVTGAPTAQAVTELHVRHGVTIMVNAQLEKFLANDDRVAGVVLSDGKVDADLVVVGIGGIANAELAADAGLAVEHGVVVGKFGQTSDPNIFAAGDCAAFPFAERLIRLESVQNAADQGVSVANAIAGEPEDYDPIPWFWSDQYDVKLQTAGLPLDYDEVVAVQSAKTGSSAFWYIKQGSVIAVDTINDPKTHMAAKRLFGLRMMLSRELLLSAQFDLFQHIRGGAGATS